MVAEADEAAGVGLPAEIWDHLVAHARAEAPMEACGVVVGGPDGRAVRYQPLRNVAPGPDWFEPDPLQLLQLTLAVEEAGETLWGIYHSHPRSPARPSESDIAYAAYPDSLYLICSLQDPAQPQIRAWRIHAGTAREVPLRRTAAQG